LSDLPPGVRGFLDEHIFSASQLEVLLLLHAADGRPLTLDEVSRDVRLPVSSIGPWLDAFVYRRLLERDGDGYCFRPDDAQTRAAVDEVAEVYARRRTTVGRYLYARGQDPLTRFADAFRFRRDADSGPDDERD
jgi:hypothetical protein